MRPESILPMLQWASLTISMPLFYFAPCPPPMRHSNQFSWPLALLVHLQQKTSSRVRSMRKVAAASTPLLLVPTTRHLSKLWQERGRITVLLPATTVKRRGTSAPIVIKRSAMRRRRRSQGRLPVVTVQRLQTPMYILQLPYRKLSLIMRVLVLPCIRHGVNVG